MGILRNLIISKKLNHISIAGILITPFINGCANNEPKDQEECKVIAAREAVSKESLGILLEACRTEFPAERKMNGGYEWRGHDVTGPKPKAEEIEQIGEKYPKIREIDGLGSVAFPSYMSEEAIDAAVYDLKNKSD